MKKNIDRSRIYHLIALCTISVVCAIIYSNTLNSPFVFDDSPNIIENPHVRLTSLNFQELYSAGTKSPSSRRPVANMSFAVNYFFGKYNVSGYHLVNIVIHLINGILVYFLAAFIFKHQSGIPRVSTSQSPNSSIPGSLNSSIPQPLNPLIGFMPLFVALIFISHPIQTQSVTYIVQRMNSLSVMFYLLSFLLYLYGRINRKKWRQYAFWLSGFISWIIALGTKEIAATLPLIIFLYEWYFFHNLSRDWLRRNFKYCFCLILIFALVVYFYLDGLVVSAILESYVNRDFTMGQRVLTQMRVIIYYISLLSFPHPSRLNLLHPIATSQSLIDPVTTLLSLALLLFCIGYAIVSARQQRLVSFCILWFFIHLAIESSIIGLEMIFEHRLYLPMVGFALLVSYIMLHYLSKRSLWVMVICVFTTVSLGAATYMRNGIWQDRKTLWSDVIAKNPRSYRAHYNLGSELSERGNHPGAIEQYHKALKIKPDHAKAHNNLGFALSKQGNLKEAGHHYYMSLKIEPNLAEAHFNLGVISEGQGKLEDAVNRYTEALRIHPGFTEARNNLGAILLKQGKLQEATYHYTEALRFNSDNPEVHNNFGLVLEEQGRLKDAVDHYIKALQIKPDYAAAYVNLGVALARQGNTKEAVRCYLMALQIKPDDAGAHNNLGAALMRRDKLNEAIDHYNKALKIKPDYAEAHNNLGIALFRLEMYEDAVDHFYDALRIDPENDDAKQNLERSLRNIKTSR